MTHEFLHVESRVVATFLELGIRPRRARNTACSQRGRRDLAQAKPQPFLGRYIRIPIKTASGFLYRFDFRVFAHCTKSAQEDSSALLSLIPSIEAAVLQTEGEFAKPETLSCFLCQELRPLRGRRSEFQPG